MAGDPPDKSNGLHQALHEPVDAASVAFFRIVFGAIMVWEVFRYVGNGWIDYYYVYPEFLFKYYGFEWVRPWSGYGMHVHFLCMGFMAGCVALGLVYRVAAVGLFLSFAFVFLQDQARYLNHFYLICLFSFLLIFIPSHRMFSIDAKLRPSIARSTVPLWTVWILRAQMGIVYFYAGLAKINPDWLAGEPMRHWLAKRNDYFLLEHFAHHEWFVYLFTYGGLMLDLSIAPLLLWRRTRAAAFCFAVMFHLMNTWLFSIGVFPWLAIAATTIFFDPDWPRRLLRCVWSTVPSVVPGRRAAALGVGSYCVTGFVVIYLSMQMLFPMRQHLYSGNVLWTEHGHRFAWRMKLRTKKGDIEFMVVNRATNERWRVNPEDYLVEKQANKMAGQPDMILQFAHFLAREWAGPEGDADGIEVYARAMVSLNYREKQLMINPDVDLSQVRRSLAFSDWIVPLTTPLKPSADADAEMDEE